MNGLAGKTALVTGGAGGIGTAICQTLLGAGCRLWFHDLPTSDGAARTERYGEKFGAGRAVFVAGDLRDLAQLGRDAHALAREADGFDFLVNNAAVDPWAPIGSYSLEEFLAIQAVNAHAAFVLCQALVPSMKRKGGGAIVNITSQTLAGGMADKVPYVMAKGALLGLTRALAREVGRDNIRVNAVSPGAIPTEMERKEWGDDRAAYDRAVIATQSLPFRGAVGDIAGAVAFLLSEKSRFITGHELLVNGGAYMG